MLMSLNHVILDYLFGQETLHEGVNVHRPSLMINMIIDAYFISSVRLARSF